MLHTGHQPATSNPIAGQLVSDQHARYVAQALEQLAEEPRGGLGVTPRLHQDVQHGAVLVNSTPQVVDPAVDPDEHLVEVPFVPGAWPAPTQPRWRRSGRTSDTT